MSVKRPHELVFGYNNDRVSSNLKTNKYMKKSKIIVDDYYWFNDNKNNDVLEIIKNENLNTHNVMNKEITKTNNIYNNILKYNKTSNCSFKTKKFATSNYLYFIKSYFDNNKKIEKNIHMRINTKTNEEIVILNEHNILNNNKKNITNVEISYDEKYCSYGIENCGDEAYELKIFEIKNYKYLTINIPKLTMCNYLWSPINNNIYYVLTDNMRLYQLWMYDFNNKTNVLIFEQKDKNLSIDLNISNNKKYIYFNNSSANDCEYYYIKLKYSSTKLFNVAKRIENDNYSIEFHNENIIVIEHNKIFIIKNSVKFCDKNKEKIISYGKNSQINTVKVFSNHLVIEYFKNGDNNYDVYNFTTKKIIKIKLNEQLCSSDIDANYIYNTNVLNIYTESFVNLPKMYEYNLDTLKSKIIHKFNVDNYNENNYTSYKKIIKTKDGTDLHLFFSHSKKLDLSKPNKIIFEGYGAYGYNIEQTFSYDKIALFDNDYIYLFANTRGSSYLGVKYYENGKLLKKNNTFNDFIECSEYLINNSYTTSEKLTIYGESAGGLLVSACLTKRPDLFKNVICKVPFIDIMTTMSDTSIPLTINEFNEWGDPNVKKYFNYMLSYCPYNNIKNVNYPNVLILAGYNDTRVKYHESLKFITKLRDYKTDNNVQLLKIDMDIGHFSSDNFYAYNQEKALIHSFIEMNICK